MNSRRLAGNFLALFGAQVVAQLAGLVTVAWLARALQPEAFGIVGFGAALLSYFGLAVVFGTDRLIMREIARDAAATATLLPRLIGLRIALLVVAAALYLLVIELIDQPGPVKTVMRVQVLGLAAAAISLDFVYQGLQRMSVIGWRQVLSSVLVLGLSVAFVRSADDVVAAAAIPHAALLLTGIWLAWRVQRDTGAVSVSVDLSAWGDLLRRASPMAVTAVMATVYLNIDVVMLGFMDSQTAVGLYAGAGRIYAIAGVIGSLLVATFLPSLAAAFGASDDMRRQYRDFALAMLLLGVPVVAVVGGFAPAVIAVLLGEGFAGASTALVLLMAAAGLNYANQIGGAALISWNREKTLMYSQGSGAVSNVALNLILIPRYGLLGAAAATIASEAIVLAIQMARTRALFGVTPLRPMLQVWTAAGAALLVVWAAGRLSGGGLGFDSAALQLAVNGGLFCALYASILWASGVADPRRLWRLVRVR
tara:strand:- start:142 stop:1581 length:1440 start_codon:yes stop_codon:yes gene_type:complete